MASSSSLPTIPDTNPTKCVYDTFRTVIAKVLSDMLPVPIEKAYSSVMYSNKTDFSVSVNGFKLKVPGAEIAQKVESEVCYFNFF